MQGSGGGPRGCARRLDHPVHGVAPYCTAHEPHRRACKLQAHEFVVRHDAVAPLGLEIAAPRALDALTIEGFELQSTAVPGLYAMNALLRNGSAHEVRWPAMELTLTDQAGAVVVRKVLLPSDYLPGASLRSASDPARTRADDGRANPPAPSSTGIKPAAEIALRTALAASDVAPTGYTVKLFYP